jgi:hypothetical protein
MMKLLVSPSSGKSSRDYVNEQQYFASGNARWPGSSKTLSIQPGDFFAFINSKSDAMELFKILGVYSTQEDIEKEKRPEWRADEYNISNVMVLSPLVHTASFTRFKVLNPQYANVKHPIGRIVWQVEEDSFYKLFADIPLAHRLDKVHLEDMKPTKEDKKETETGGCVYFIREQDIYNSNHTKIGFSTLDPQDRLKQLQTGNPRLLYVHASVSCGKPRQFEKYLHDCFGKRHCHGEWYTLTGDEINKLVAFLADGRNA